MNESLDNKIFETFIQAVDDKKLLTGKNIAELKGFINKTKVTTEDWDLLVDKECFPASKEENNAE